VGNRSEKKMRYEKFKLRWVELIKKHLIIAQTSPDIFNAQELSAIETFIKPILDYAQSEEDKLNLKYNNQNKFVDINDDFDDKTISYRIIKIEGG